MSRFTLSKIFTPWTSAATPPQRPGWYRIRTEPLTHSWWNGMAFWDGLAWWEFGKHVNLAVRREIRVLTWQGLRMPMSQAAQMVLDNLPKSANSRRAYLRFLATCGITVPA
jgi:hypothetical protein